MIWFDLFWLHSFFTHFFAVLITLDMFGHDIFLSFLIYIAFLFFDHLPIYYCITKDSLHLLGTLSAEKGQGWQSVNLHFCRRSKCSMMQLPQTSNVIKPVDCRNSCIQYQSGQKRWHLWSRTLYIYNVTWNMKMIFATNAYIYIHKLYDMHIYIYVWNIWRIHLRP